MVKFVYWYNDVDIFSVICIFQISKSLRNLNKMCTKRVLISCGVVNLKRDVMLERRNGFVK